MADKLKAHDPAQRTAAASVAGDVPMPEVSHANGATPRTTSASEVQWEKTTLRQTLAKSPERQKTFTSISGHPIRRLYTEADLAGWDAARDLGLPGEPPYTRGIHSTMHRG